MELKYDIYTLNNAQGTGEKRQYVRIVQHEPMTEKQLQEKIQNRCSLTKGDVAAVLAELHDLLVEEFSMGHRFYIPEIGYFSMSASLEMPEENPDKKITGKEVRITGINFRPEEKLMKEVQRNVHFVRSFIPTNLQNTQKKRCWRKSRSIFKRIVTSPLASCASTSAWHLTWLRSGSLISARKISWWRMELPMRLSIF